MEIKCDERMKLNRELKYEYKMKFLFFFLKFSIYTKHCTNISTDKFA